MRGPKNPARKLVMVALADNANDYGICWPGYALIAHKSSVSVRTTMRTIEALVAENWISVEKRAVQKINKKTKKNRPGHLNRYQINLAKLGLSRDNLSPEAIESRDILSPDSLACESPLQKPRKPVQKLRKTSGKGVPRRKSVT